MMIKYIISRNFKIMYFIIVRITKKMDFVENYWRVNNLLSFLFVGTF